LIRPYAATDLERVLELGAMMHAESRYASLDFDPDKLVDLSDAVLTNPAYLCLVAEEEGEVVGLIVGYVIPHWFGNDLTSGDLAVYVAPEHRKGMIGVKLVKAYTAWAKSMGVKEPMLGVSAGITPARIGDLYKRLGYTETFVVYKMPMEA
jgi:GNAT superfamily N-acetyltransferase